MWSWEILILKARILDTSLTHIIQEKQVYNILAKINYIKQASILQIIHACTSLNLGLGRWS